MITARRAVTLSTIACMLHSRKRAWRSARATFLPLLLLGCSNAAVAATIAISVASNADTIEIEATALLDADVATSWRVLTDYERYVDFIPGLRESRILGRKGATVTVQESGEVTLWLLRMALNVTFAIIETAPTRLDSHVVSGDLRALNSRYVLVPVDNAVRLEYAGKLNSGLALFAPIEQFAVKQNVAHRFKALADEIERQHAASRSPADAAASPAR